MKEFNKHLCLSNIYYLAKKKNVKIKSCLQRCAGPFTVILTLRLPKGTAITFSSPRKEHKTNVLKLLY